MQQELRGVRRRTYDNQAHNALQVAGARLSFAFDRRCETGYFYNQPGRSWYLTLRYTPKSL